MASTSKSCKKKYGTYFNTSYTEEFKCIISSKLSESYAFCTICCTDFSIFHHGRGDMEKHLSRNKHRNAVQLASANKKIDFICKKDELSVFRAESLFTAFLVEHNCRLVHQIMQDLYSAKCSPTVKLPKDMLKWQIWTNLQNFPSTV